jgi:Holliday junction resolvasome RuvABC DNA-binding subunit
MTADRETAVEPGDNQRIAALLREMASLLQSQGDGPWRVGAYRNAAATIERLPRNLREIWEGEGVAGLDALPTVGPGIAAAIDEILRTGNWSRLERLRGESGVEAIFKTIPGIGDQLAQRLHDELGVESLEALEVAAHDGRLAGLPGIGARRAASIRAVLTQMLDRRRALQRARRTREAVRERSDASLTEPAVETLLQVDRDYRAAAEAGKLPTIAPRRFNPGGQAWLPVLHTRVGDWHFTALYSNTARAHELGRVRDWVVVYAEDPAHHERQYTVVTSPRGLLAGRRTVRGREDECNAWYASHRGVALEGETEA